MKAEIKEGGLFIIPESNTEQFAIDKWFEMQEINKCLGEIKTKSLFSCIYRRKKTIKERFQLWMLNHNLIK